MHQVVANPEPLPAERLERMRQAAPASAGPPILSDDEWKALRQVCAPATRQ